MKKILFIIHPDCIFERPDFYDIPEYISKIKQAVLSGEYEEILTELFFPEKFNNSDWFESWEESLQTEFLNFVKFLKHYTLAFYSYESRATQMFKSKMFSLLEDDLKNPDTIFCFAGGYQELCLNNAIEAFKYYTKERAKHQLKQELSFKNWRV